MGPSGDYISLMTTKEDHLMAQITLNLPAYSLQRLESALQAEIHVWERIRLEALSGSRPNASPEGAQLLIEDTKLILDQLKQWKERG
jgi:hypothetical protein